MGSYSETQRRRLAKGVPLSGPDSPGGDEPDDGPRRHFTRSPIEQRYFHHVPFDKKEEAKKEGMRWDPDKKKWYHRNHMASRSSKFPFAIFNEATELKVEPKNHSYGWIGTHKVSEKDHAAATKEWAPHIKKHLDDALKRHQASDKHFEKVTGSTTTSAKVRAGIKVDHKTVAHFLDSSHGRHLAHHSVAGKKPTDPKVVEEIKKRASEFTRSYHPSQFDESVEVEYTMLKEDVSTKRADRKAVTTTKPDGTRETKWARTSQRDIVKEAVENIAEFKLISEEYSSHEEASAALERHQKKFPSAKLSVTKGSSGKYHVMKHTSGGSSRVTS